MTDNHENALQYAEDFTGVPLAQVKDIIDGKIGPNADPDEVRAVKQAYLEHRAH